MGLETNGRIVTLCGCTFALIQSQLLLFPNALTLISYCCLYFQNMLATLNNSSLTFITSSCYNRVSNVVKAVNVMLLDILMCNTNLMEIDIRRSMKVTYITNMIPFSLLILA